ncbi:MAG: dihydroorotase, partial [Flavobacteriaceae bacterium]|nr:dihydroorotase [Flavobacteriaceae bacterium]
MKIIIREAKIIDPKSSFHNQVVDVKINNGTIEKIGNNLAPSDDYQEIKTTNLHLSQGWFD